jgi:hypothetical protein
MDDDLEQVAMRSAARDAQLTTYGGLSADDLSRTIVAYDSGYPNPEGWPLGYVMWAPAKRRIGWVHDTFRGTRDAKAMARGRRLFLKQMATVMPVDWLLPGQVFIRSIEVGLTEHFPALSSDAREVLVARFNHLRCEPMAVAIGSAMSARLARRSVIAWVCGRSRC